MIPKYDGWINEKNKILPSLYDEDGEYELDLYLKTIL